MCVVNVMVVELSCLVCSHLCSLRSSRRCMHVCTYIRMYTLRTAANKGGLQRRTQLSQLAPKLAPIHTSAGVRSWRHQQRSARLGLSAGTTTVYCNKGLVAVSCSYFLYQVYFFIFLCSYCPPVYALLTLARLLLCSSTVLLQRGFLVFVHNVRIAKTKRLGRQGSLLRVHR